MFNMIFICLGVFCIMISVNCEKKIVVDSECVYTKIDEILGEKFNTTTQICCKGSGVHDKYQLGQEVECCGERIYRKEKEMCCNGQVHSKDNNVKNCKQRTQILDGWKVTKTRYNRRQIMEVNGFVGRVWKSWLRKFKQRRPLMIIFKAK
eukprot:XP_011430801.1 PREDICTED: uncharacterized protein LOC105330648 [Crassostrea gigas]